MESVAGVLKGLKIRAVCITCVDSFSACRAKVESIEGIIEEPAFSPSNNLAPPHHLPHSSVSKLDRRHTGRQRKRGNLLTEGGGTGV